jgi:hypothetical protein
MVLFSKIPKLKPGWINKEYGSTLAVIPAEAGIPWLFPDQLQKGFPLSRE